MLSEEAEKYLNRMFKPVSNDDRLLRVYNRNMAEKAVWKAENEMGEKAVRCYCESCENSDHDDGTLMCEMYGKDLRDCVIRNDFIRFLFNRE